MNRNVLYGIFGALALVVGVVGYQPHQERQKQKEVYVGTMRTGQF